MRRKSCLTVRLDTDVPPGGFASYPLPFAIPTVPGEYAVDVSFRLRQATAWAPAGHEVGWEQAVFTVTGPVPERTPGDTPRPAVITGAHNIGVRGPHFLASFSRLHGAANASPAQRGRALASRLTAVAAVLLAKADAAQESICETGTSTSSWLAVKSGLSKREAAGFSSPAAGTRRPSTTMRCSNRPDTEPATSGRSGSLRTACPKSSRP